MRKLSSIAVLSLLVVALAAAAAFAVDSTTSFKMVRSQKAVANDCLEGAKAHVDVRTTPTDQQVMDVSVNHAPKNTEFELFVTQQPNSPFGVSWYQADFTTNNQGNGEVRARGIFSEELFVFAPGSVKAPQVDNQDAEKNPAFDPVHTFHLGLWFGDPEDAKDAGCSDTVTAFDGDHEAGIQAFSTRNFPKLEGPLGEIQ
jgi:type II secretory pathway pseudopilin PulG